MCMNPVFLKRKYSIFWWYLSNLGTLEVLLLKFFKWGCFLSLYFKRNWNKNAWLSSARPIVSILQFNSEANLSYPKFQKWNPGFVYSEENLCNIVHFYQIQAHHWSPCQCHSNIIHSFALKDSSKDAFTFCTCRKWGLYQWHFVG